jgi:nitric oxide reductase subunit C
MKFKARHTFFILCTLFLIYSFSIYMQPISVSPNSNFDVKVAAEGRLVWQKYNCQTCHQLYSLGGYLGPDLTNIISHPQKGENLVRAMIKTGTKQMPSFNLTDNEMIQLIEFLKSVDASGIADPRSFVIKSNGMIEHGKVK